MLRKKRSNLHIRMHILKPLFCSCMGTVVIIVYACVWEKRHSLKNSGWGRQGKQAEREFHFHGNQAVQASVPSVIQLYTDRAWHHQHCSLVCSAQESECQIITAVFHSEQSCIGVCGIVDVLAGGRVGGCFGWFYCNIRCLCCAHSSLSLFLVTKYVMNVLKGWIDIKSSHLEMIFPLDVPYTVLVMLGFSDVCSKEL